MTLLRIASSVGASSGSAGADTQPGQVRRHRPGRSPSSGAASWLNSGSSIRPSGRPAPRSVRGADDFHLGIDADWSEDTRTARFPDRRQSPADLERHLGRCRIGRNCADKRVIAANRNCDDGEKHDPPFSRRHSVRIRARRSISSSSSGCGPTAGANCNLESSGFCILTLSCSAFGHIPPITARSSHAVVRLGIVGVSSLTLCRVARETRRRPPEECN